MEKATGWKQSHFLKSVKNLFRIPIHWYRIHDRKNNFCKWACEYGNKTHNLEVNIMAVKFRHWFEGVKFPGCLFRAGWGTGEARGGEKRHLRALGRSCNTCRPSSFPLLYILMQIFSSRAFARALGCAVLLCAPIVVGWPTHTALSAPGSKCHVPYSPRLQVPIPTTVAAHGTARGTWASSPNQSGRPGACSLRAPSPAPGTANTR